VCTIIGAARGLSLRPRGFRVSSSKPSVRHTVIALRKGGALSRVIGLRTSGPQCIFQNNRSSPDQRRRHVRAAFGLTSIEILPRRKTPRASLPENFKAALSTFGEVGGELPLGSGAFERPASRRFVHHHSGGRRQHGTAGLKTAVVLQRSNKAEQTSRGAALWTRWVWQEIREAQRRRCCPKHMLRVRRRTLRLTRAYTIFLQMNAVDGRTQRQRQTLPVSKRGW